VTYAILTFGCRVNQADSQRIDESFRARGAEPASPDTAALVVVNTCAVTCSAEQGARQAVRRVARINPGARIVVTGCYATRAPSEVGALPSVVRVITNDAKDGLVESLADEIPASSSVRFGSGDGPCGSPLVPGAMGRTALTLRVQTGCDERCSFCIIPRTRGTSRSLPPGEVLAMARRAAGSGFREIVLTGVHLGSYGRDLEPRANLATLLARLAALNLDAMFRISSLEPMDCGPELVELVAASPNLAPHFHLPLQHASDRILHAMRRPYRLDAYRALVDRVRERLPHAAIGSDILIGFPGESDDDFERMAQYLVEAPLTHLHVFPYSDRPGTDAALLPGRVPGAVVRDRAAAVRAIGAVLAERFRRSQVGTVRRGLTLEDGTLVVTDNFLKVRIRAGRGRNEWVDVRIEGSDGRATVVEVA
jgi:threonylcarbamoyladenosine tRNA methylthiotransferase MtaB